MHTAYKLPFVSQPEALRYENLVDHYDAHWRPHLVRVIRRLDFSNTLLPPVLARAAKTTYPQYNSTSRGST